MTRRRYSCSIDGLPSLCVYEQMMRDPAALSRMMGAMGGLGGAGQAASGEGSGESSNGKLMMREERRCHGQHGFMGKGAARLMAAVVDWFVQVARPTLPISWHSSNGTSKVSPSCRVVFRGVRQPG